MFRIQSHLTRVGLAVAATLLAAAPALSLSGSLASAERQCAIRIESLQTQADRRRLIGICVAAVGGLVAAGTGLRAGLTEKSISQKWGVLALIAGVLSAVSPALPRAEDIHVKVLLADRQHTVGLKMERQLDYLDPNGAFRTHTEQYAIARFTECLAEEPAKEIPDPPKS